MYIKYYPYGYCRNSQEEIDALGTDKLFTGQRLDDTGLYYYKSPVSTANPCSVTNSPLIVTGMWSGRYYDPTIGRFISPDTIVPDLYNPQSLNRYSYAQNRPLYGPDIDGHILPIIAAALASPWVRGAAIGAVVYTAGRFAVNVIEHRDEGIANTVFKHGLEGWNLTDFTEATAIGAATGGVSSLKAISELSVLAQGAIKVAVATGGGCAQYGLDVAEGQADLTEHDFNLYAGTAFVTGAIIANIPGGGILNAASAAVAKTAMGIIRGLDMDEQTSNLDNSSDLPETSVSYYSSDDNSWDYYNWFFGDY